MRRQTDSAQQHSGNGRPGGLQTWLDGLHQTAQFNNMAKELVHPGHDPLELMMRTCIQNEKKANALVLFYHKILKFKMNDSYIKLVLAWMASRTSIEGLARMQFLEAYVGVIAPQLHNKSPNAFPPDRAKGKGSSEEQ